MCFSLRSAQHHVFFLGAKIHMKFQNQCKNTIAFRFHKRTLLFDVGPAPFKILRISELSNLP